MDVLNNDNGNVSKASLWFVWGFALYLLSYNEKLKVSAFLKLFWHDLYVTLGKFLMNSFLSKLIWFCWSTYVEEPKI